MIAVKVFCNGTVYMGIRNFGALNSSNIFMKEKEGEEGRECVVNFLFT